MPSTVAPNTLVGGMFPRALFVLAPPTLAFRAAQTMTFLASNNGSLNQ